jgi:hypothetical protein
MCHIESTVVPKWDRIKDDEWLTKRFAIALVHAFCSGKIHETHQWESPTHRIVAEQRNLN